REVAVRPADDERALEARHDEQRQLVGAHHVNPGGRKAAREDLPPAFEGSDDVIAEIWALFGGLDGHRNDWAAGPEVARQKALAVLVKQGVDRPQRVLGGCPLEPPCDVLARVVRRLAEKLLPAAGAMVVHRAARRPTVLADCVDAAAPAAPL